MDTIQCPHCGTGIVATSDGICPSCRQSLRTPTTVAPSPAPQSAWSAFQRTLEPDANESPISRLRKFHKKYVPLRSASLNSLSEGPQRELAYAEQIQGEVLPWLDAELMRLSLHLGVDATEPEAKSRKIIAGLLEQERKCWTLLAESIQENDSAKLKQHIESWDQLELNLMGADGGKKLASKPNAFQLSQAFHRALVTFTPRLLALPAIIAANVAVFVLMLMCGMDFVSPAPQFMKDWGANFGPRTMNGEWWRLVTNLFLHYGIVHLGMNMWVLWDVGRLMERLVGHVGFLVLYVVSGLAASITSLAWNPTVVSAGASGAVFGVVGALLGFIALRRDTIPDKIVKHLMKSLGIFLAYNILYGVQASGIDHAAHVGGLAAGFFCGLMLSQPLTLEMLHHRWRRNLIAISFGALTLPIACAALPSPPPDANLELQRFENVEKKALGLFNELANRAQREEISNAEFADAIATKILPPWSETRLQIDALATAPYANRTLFLKLADYMKERELAWNMYIEAFRESDLAKTERASRHMKAADEIAESLSSQ